MLQSQSKLDLVARHNLQPPSPTSVGARPHCDHLGGRPREKSRSNLSLKIPLPSLGRHFVKFLSNDNFHDIRHLLLISLSPLLPHSSSYVFLWQFPMLIFTMYIVHPTVSGGFKLQINNEKKEKIPPKNG